MDTYTGRGKRTLNPIHVLIVDDHPLMADATARTLEQIEQVHVIGVVHNGLDCLRLVETKRPHIVILDFNLPEMYGDEVSKAIKAIDPSIHIVIFTGIEFVQLYDHLIGLEVSAVLSKETSGTVLRSLILLLGENFTVLPIPFLHKLRLTHNSGDSAQVLQADDVEIMNMITQGMTNEQIAAKIYMSKRTVDNYIRKIYDKMEVKSRAQAIEKFTQNKFTHERKLL